MLPADIETFFWSHEAAEPEPANELCDQKGPGKFVFLLTVVGLCLFYILDCSNLCLSRRRPPVLKKLLD